MSIELYPSIAKIKRNGVYENLPGFVPETGSVATQQMIATAESSATAQYVHNKGEYFRLNDTLYQAIVKINVGDAIVVGTNCEVAVISNDLTHVANSIAAYELGIATSSHNTGDYFMVNETMYVATADIQVGDTISTSTNCRLAVVGDELSELKTALNEVSIATYKIMATKGATANTSGPLIPFVAKNGDSITAYTVDGTTFGDVQLRFYNEAKTYIKHWTLASGYGKTRTFTFDQSTEAYYVGITTVSTNSPDNYYVINNNNIYKKANDELQSEIETVQTNMDVLEGQIAIKNIINRFNPNTITAGKYINITNGSLANSADFFASDFIYIGDLDKVTVSYTHLFCWYDADKGYVTPNPSYMNSRANDLTFDVPENVEYLRFSTYNADLNLSQVGGEVSRASYIPYGKYSLPDLVVDDGNIIIVDITGNGDYTSLTEALYDNVDNGVDIYVKPGIYDLATEYVAKFGQTAVDNMQDTDTATFNGFQFGAIIRNRKITFEAGSHVVCDWTNHTVDNTHRFSAIRVDYNAEIIGLHLTATNTFYVIHDDYGTSLPYENKYENCHIVGVDLVNSNCIGGGCKKYSKHFINNCYFDNGVNSSTVVRYHNTNVVGAEPEIYVSNCYFNGSFTPRWFGGQTDKMRVYVNNCEAQSIYKVAESSSATVDNVELFKWCNTEKNPVT